MTPNEFDPAVGDHRVKANQAIEQLDAEELFALISLVRGMSRKAIAHAAGRSPDHLERTLSSLMKKLNAEMIADAVRIGLYAGVDRLS